MKGLRFPYHLPHHEAHLTFKSHTTTEPAFRPVLCRSPILSSHRSFDRPVEGRYTRDASLVVSQRSKGKGSPNHPERFLPSSGHLSTTLGTLSSPFGTGQNRVCIVGRLHTTVETAEPGTAMQSDMVLTPFLLATGHTIRYSHRSSGNLPQRGRPAPSCRPSRPSIGGQVSGVC